ncbi:hypothetical protein PRZ48_012200 [Zasmidium cellare]|uniref:Uncharacterized protein n=1 Tax=Zasmidium cellare TaxID=395010 RepID=A0ABR0E459_ZASCE|nr:hypothetical protein PRZ48_012200 [Zasmidium cellare]
MDISQQPSNDATSQSTNQQPLALPDDPAANGDWHDPPHLRHLTDEDLLCGALDPEELKCEGLIRLAKRCSNETLVKQFNRLFRRFEKECTVSNWFVKNGIKVALENLVGTGPKYEKYREALTSMRPKRIEGKRQEELMQELAKKFMATPREQLGQRLPLTYNWSQLLDVPDESYRESTTTATGRPTRGTVANKRTIEDVQQIPASPGTAEVLRLRSALSKEQQRADYRFDQLSEKDRKLSEKDRALWAAQQEQLRLKKELGEVRHELDSTRQQLDDVRQQLDQQRLESCHHKEDQQRERPDEIDQRPVKSLLPIDGLPAGSAGMRKSLLEKTNELYQKIRSLPFVASQSLVTGYPESHPDVADLYAEAFEDDAIGTHLARLRRKAVSSDVAQMLISARVVQLLKKASDNDYQNFWPNMRKALDDEVPACDLESVLDNRLGGLTFEDMLRYTYIVGLSRTYKEHSTARSKGIKAAQEFVSLLRTHIKVISDPSDCVFQDGNNPFANVDRIIVEACQLRCWISSFPSKLVAVFYPPGYEYDPNVMEKKSGKGTIVLLTLFPGFGFGAAGMSMVSKAKVALTEEC